MSSSKKKFLAVFIGSEDSVNGAKWEALDDKTRAEREQSGMAAWGKWVQVHHASIVDNGSPLGKTIKVDVKGLAPAKNAIAAYTVVEADSHEEAARMFVGHPHFTIFPGDSVEIMEALPIPGM